MLTQEVNELCECELSVIRIVTMCIQNKSKLGMGVGWEVEVVSFACFFVFM